MTTGDQLTVRMIADVGSRQAIVEPNPAGAGAMQPWMGGVGPQEGTAAVVVTYDDHIRLLHDPTHRACRLRIRRAR
jgi:hypothetical protein